jgi:hypothetical protein
MIAGMKRPLLAGFAVLALLCAPARAAGVHAVDVPQQLAEVLASVKKHTTVGVLLPQRLTVDVARLYASGGGTRNGWSMSLSGAPGCGSATACFIADFTARRGGELPTGSHVRLRGGVVGVFHAISCGGSCAPASISWRRKGVLYEIQDKPLGNERTTMVALANQALAAGPR